MSGVLVREGGKGKERDGMLGNGSVLEGNGSSKREVDSDPHGE